MTKRQDLTRTFDARWKQLALSETVDLASDETITCETFASEKPDLDATRTIGRIDASPASLRTLPRISLGGTSGPTSGAPERHQPDLELARLLGEGGMGRVHLAHQRSLRRDVAVKTLKEQADAGAQQALFSEAVITGSLEHPSIIPVHALGTDDAGRPVLVMKRVEGVEWRELLQDPGHPAWNAWTDGSDRLVAIVEIVMRLCSAVEFAHSRGVVHRDIKPENVMIGQFGEAYLVDFGVALRKKDAEAAAGQLCGTPGYMAPEMAIGGQVDERTDVYLLGATLHEALTGTLRHEGETLHDVLLKAFLSEPYDYGPDVPAELALLCNEATSRERVDRPQSVQALRQGLSDYLRHRGSVAMSAAAHDRLERLQPLLGETERREDTEWLGTVQELMAEARFGFGQALDEWPENPAAREGLEACLESMTRFEVSRENLAAARSFLGQMTDPDGALLEAVEALDEKLAEERERRDRLESMARDRDVTVASKPRFAVSILVAIVVSSVSVSVFSSSEGTAGVTPGSALTFAVYIFVAVVLLLVVFRRAILASAFNRGFAGLFVVVGLAILTHRIGAYFTSATIPEIFVVDSLLMATTAAVGAVTLHRLLALPAVVLAAGAIASFARPELAVDIFAGSTTVSIVIGLVALRRAR